MTILKRGDFWILLYAGLILFSMVFWGRIAIDVQQHDTYYVISYQRAIQPVMAYLILVILIYFFAYLRSGLKQPLTFIHVILTIATLSYSIFLVFGVRFALAGMPAGYYSYSSYEDFVSVYWYILANILIFLFAQVIFVINVVRYRKKPTG